ncbi:MAG: class IV adenylate cyclase [Anaerolineae bacterium]|nr:class IV adenylate cyclase [Anaerolineae bacterium]
MTAGHQHLEVEAKLRVPDLDEMRTRLNADPEATCTVPRLHEYNIRYEDAAHSLDPAGIVLRLRRDRPLYGGAARVRLTYKAPLSKEQPARPGQKAMFEAETEVADFKTMDLILQRMGYHVAMAYEKYRTTYEILGTEVVLDEMPFGPFVEVEGRPDAIEAVIVRLGLDGNERFTDSYATLFEYVKIHLNLVFRDLTFENFAGVKVPAYAFSPIVRLS